MIRRQTEIYRGSGGKGRLQTRNEVARRAEANKPDRLSLNLSNVGT
jgi:hypothetical protein